MKHEEEWKKAKKLCRLSNEDIRMARELGMGPLPCPQLRSGEVPAASRRVYLSARGIIPSQDRHALRARRIYTEGWGG
jgi:hypothetical protein